MSGNITQGFGFNKGGSSGGGGTNTNIANADLTSDGNHTLDIAATTLTIDSGTTDVAKFNGTTNKITFGPSGDDYTFPDERPTSTGDVLGAADTSGNLEWITPTPNTNTNVANADLTLDANHTTDVGANTLTFDSGASNIIQLVGSDDTLTIGGASPYKMPTARGTQNEILGLTNNTGTAAWRTMTNTTADIQTRAGQGLLTNTFTSRDLFVPSPSNTLINIGNTSTLTATTNVVINTLTEPFRQSGTSSITFATGTDRVQIKMNFGTTDTFDVYLIQANMATSTPISSTPITLTLLGSIAYARANQWHCEEIDLTGVEISFENCSCAWIGLSPRTSTEEELTFQFIANYVNPREVTASYS